MVSAVPVDQVQPVEAAPGQLVRDRHPEILERPPAAVQRPGKSLAVHAHSVWEHRQRKNLLRRSLSHPFSNRFDDQRVRAHRQVVAVLLGVTHRQHDHPAAQVVGRQSSGRRGLAGVEQADLLRSSPQIQVLRREQVHPGETVLSQAVGQVMQQRRQGPPRHDQPAARPAVRRRRQQSDSLRLAQRTGQPSH